MSPTPEPTHARTLAEGLDRLVSRLPETLPPAFRQLVEDAYYVGASVLYDMLIRSPELGDESDEPGVALLQRIGQELAGRGDALRARVLQQRMRTMEAAFGPLGRKRES